METYKFEAEINQLMNLIINAFYSNKDVFLRELISNSSDALDKIRYMSLTNKELIKDEPEFCIKIIPNKEQKTLTIMDTGIGMTKDELIKNLGTIARSGTKAFLETFKEAKDLNLIGQFGVGFYSAFLVGNKVEVISKSINSDKSYKWESKADGIFTISEYDDSELKRGTKVIIHMNDDTKEYLDEYKLRNIIERHSNYISYPIQLRVQKTKSKKDKKEDKNKEDKKEKEEERKEDKEKEEKEKEKEEKEKEKEENNEEIQQETHSKEEKPTIQDVNEDEKKDKNEEDKKENNEEEHQENHGKEEKEKEEEPKIEDVNEDEVESEEVKEDKEKEQEMETYYEFERVNKHEPLWTRNPTEIKEEEYKEFYKSISNDWNDYLFVNHFKTEGSLEFTSLLFVPKQAPFDMFQTREWGKGVKLYVRRVFITDKCEELIPEYLSFLKGLVDSNDLPLNVSREMLQQNTIMKKMKKHIIKKLLETFIQCADEDKDKFKTFYEQYSKNIKLGIYEDSENREKLIKLVRFFSSKHKDEQISLQQYVNEMKEGQKDIYYITGESMMTLEDSPFLETLKKYDYDVLFLIDPIDEYAFQHISEFEGKKLIDITKENFNLSREEKKEEKIEEQYKDLCKHMKDILGDKVDKVTISNRQFNAPCILTTGQFGWSANMERIMKAQALKNNEMSMFMRSRKTMELNPEHKLIKLLKDKFIANKDDKTVKDLTYMFYETALLTSGFSLEKPSLYAKRIYNMLSVGLCGETLDDYEDDMPQGEKINESDQCNTCKCDISTTEDNKKLTSNDKIK